jgi:hypothetical protein
MQTDAEMQESQHQAVRLAKRLGLSPDKPNNPTLAEPSAGQVQVKSTNSQMPAPQPSAMGLPPDIPVPARGVAEPVTSTLASADKARPEPGIAACGTKASGERVVSTGGFTGPALTAAVTAAQIESDCPAELQQLGKRIAAHLEKARKYEEKADQHYRTISQYLAEAKQTCDEGGFIAFREKFFPDLGRSRVYELLSIASNKKSIAGVKADTRKRVAKHRAKMLQVSVTVTDKAQIEPVRGECARTGEATSEASVTVTDKVRPNLAKLPETTEIETDPQTDESIRQQPAALAKSPPADNDALAAFDNTAVQLKKIIDNTSLERLKNTRMDRNDLEKLSVLLAKVAKLKLLPSNFGQGTPDLSPEQSAKARKSENCERRAGTSRLSGGITLPAVGSPGG